MILLSIIELYIITLLLIISIIRVYPISFLSKLAILQGRYRSLRFTMSFFRSTYQSFLGQKGTKNHSDYFQTYANTSLSLGSESYPFIRYTTLTKHLQYLRISFQQGYLLSLPRLLLILCPLFTLLLTLAIIAVILNSIFFLYRVYLSGLFILIIDYIDTAQQYQWLVRQITKGQTRVRRILYYILAIILFLLIITIIGTAQKL